MGSSPTSPSAPRFPEARDIFWDADRLAAAWRGDRRIFLVSASAPSGA